MHNYCICDECITPCDTTKNLRHANPEPQHSLTTNIIVYIVEYTRFLQPYRKILILFAILLSEKHDLSNFPAKLRL